MSPPCLELLCLFCVIKEKIKTKKKKCHSELSDIDIKLTPCHVCYFSGARIKYCDLRKEEFNLVHHSRRRVLNDREDLAMVTRSWPLTFHPFLGRSQDRKCGEAVTPSRHTPQ